LGMFWASVMISMLVGKRITVRQPLEKNTNALRPVLT